MKGKALSVVARRVVQEIQDIWYLAKIPYHAPEKLEKLFNRWRWLQKRRKEDICPGIATQEGVQ